MAAMKSVAKLRAKFWLMENFLPGLKLLGQYCRYRLNLAAKSLTDGGVSVRRGWLKMTKSRFASGCFGFGAGLLCMRVIDDPEFFIVFLPTLAGLSFFLMCRAYFLGACECESRKGCKKCLPPWKETFLGCLAFALVICVMGLLNIFFY